jgi:hypothetical protein
MLSSALTSSGQFLLVYARLQDDKNLVNSHFHPLKLIMCRLSQSFNLWLGATPGLLCVVSVLKPWLYSSVRGKPNGRDFGYNKGVVLLS